MSVGSISTARLVLDASKVSSNQAVTGSLSTTSLTSQIKTDRDVNAAVQVDISKPSELYSKLQKMQTDDPDKFKQVTAEIATKLQTLADSKSGTEEGKKIGELAAKFKSVSEGGDITQIKPPSETSGTNGTKGAPPAGGPHGGGGPPGGADKSSSSSSTSSSSTVYDKADTNKDGKVSALELIAYALKQADEAKSTAATSTKTDAATTSAASVSLDTAA